MDLQTTALAQTAAAGAGTASSLSQTPLWLSLGVLLGIAYALGTNKYEHAMQVPHLFVRGAMLWLSCASWLGAAVALSFVCYQINRQNNSLDGLDRVFSILVPVVVRADLIVDWAKRVMWAVFLMPTWTQGCVALRRILCRSSEIESLIAVDTDVLEIATVCDNDFVNDLDVAENLVWAQGAESLAKFSEMLEHLQKLARVSIYAGFGLVFAIPGAIFWIIYAAYKGYCSWRDHFRRLAILYWISVGFAPIGALVVVFASVVLLVGIVSLSVLGACIQFGVYWSTRIVYSVVRMILGQAWADFPFLMLREVPGAAAALLSSVHLPSSIAHSTRAATGLPSDAPPPGVPAEIVPRNSARTAAYWQESPTGALGSCDPGFSTDAAADSDGNAQTLNQAFANPSRASYRYHGKSVTRHPAEAGAAIARVGTFLPTDLEFILASWEGTGIQHAKVPFVTDHDKFETKNKIEPKSDGDGVLRQDSSANWDKQGGREVDKIAGDLAEEFPNGRDAMLLRMLGMDDKVNTPVKRRLSTYYALGMLVQMQLNSGGNSWQLHQDCLLEPAATDLNAFIDFAVSKESRVAAEAAEAVIELSERLRAAGKYRFVPVGGRNIPVDVWIRAVLIALLRDPSTGASHGTNAGSDRSSKDLPSCVSHI